MKNNRFYINEILVAFLLTFFFLGCSSKDDSDDSGSVEERTIIKMDIPEIIDWNNVEVVWREEFSGSAKIDDIWYFEPKNTTNPDVADQLQTYSDKTVSISGGTLKITAQREGGNYYSARVNSKYAFEYGRIEISAKLPGKEKRGLWAKMALIGNNKNSVGWPQAGEIDFMEYFSYKPNDINVIVHTAANYEMGGTLNSTNYYLETAEEEFHAYGILWTDKYIKFYIDDIDNIIYTLDRPSSPTEQNWPFNKPFFLLVDLVIGGRYTGPQGVDDSLFPAVMEIDYIRVYHLD